MFVYFTMFIFVKMSHVIKNAKYYDNDNHNCWKSCKSSFLWRIFLIYVLIFIPAFVKSDDEVSNNTSLELDLNLTTYNDSYGNLTFHNISEFFVDDNKTFDTVTELGSIVSITEDSEDSSLQGESSRKLFLFLTPDEDICNCDLTENVCDVNCCCDPDCKEEEMLVFSECAHQVLTPDENYCYQKDIILRNNTVYKMVKNPSNNMFCILHDNFKHRLRFKDMPTLKSHRDLTAVLRYKYMTTYSWDVVSETVFDSSELKAGSPIYVNVKSGEKTITSYWSLPSSCLSKMCNCQEDVSYLHDFRSTCTLVVGNLKQLCGSKDAGLLSDDPVLHFCISPRSSAASGIVSLADLVVHTRSVSDSNTSDAHHSPDTLCAEGRPLRTEKRGASCANVVRNVNFTVRHDGVVGITGLSVHFAYANVPLDSKALTRGYSVSFVWSNASTGERKSGNPGYQVGLPILAATNGSDDAGATPYEMSRAFYGVGLSVLDRDDGSICSRSRRRVIQFGKNLKTGCTLKNDFASCKNLQSAVSDVLLGLNKNQVYVGVFGNANASEPDDWIQVFHEESDTTTPGGTSSGVDDCRASLGLKIDVVYAAVGTVANPQHKIVGVSYRRTQPQFVDLKCAPSSCGDVILWTSVSFFDVTLPAVEHYSKVPSIKVNLPSDFFYPFLYGRGSKNAPSLASLAITLLCCLLRAEFLRK